MSASQVILLVEDNDDDAELTIKAFHKAQISNEVRRARDGVEALDMLFARGVSAGKPLDPAVVLLDINLPRLNGIEVLKQIRAEPRTQHLPVVMLTSSDEDKDRLAAYQNWANSYIRKPVDYDQFVQAARQLGLYWMVLNRPAPGRR